MNLREAAEMALEALESVYGKGQRCEAAIEALRQALDQTEHEPLGGEWVPCVKLPVIVHVRNQRDGETHISTREGITPVLPDDLIMRGVAGEEYPIGRELFERTYTFDVDSVNMSEECVHKTDKCEQEPVCFLRETSWSYEIAPWDDQNGFPVYTAPPVSDYHEGWEEGFKGAKREWVGLTDEEIIKCFDSVAFGQVEDDLIINKHVNIFRAIHGIEAKLKEKNT